MNKGINIGCVVLRELVQLVVEGTDVGTLFVKSFQQENGIETLHQFVERQLQQFVGVLAISLWQQFVERTVFYQKLTLCFRIAQYGTLIEFSDDGFG